jgi:hypothetical protein
MLFLRVFFMSYVVLLALIIPAGSQEINSLSVGPAHVRGNAPHHRETFKHEISYIDLQAKQIIRYTQKVDLKSYTNPSSAAATGCQVFKEQGQNLWWANCGAPINDVAVLSNLQEG